MRIGNCSYFIVSNRWCQQYGRRVPPELPDYQVDIRGYVYYAIGFKPRIKSVLYHHWTPADIVTSIVTGYRKRISDLRLSGRLRITVCGADMPCLVTDMTLGESVLLFSDRAYGLSQQEVVIINEGLHHGLLYTNFSWAILDKDCITKTFRLAVLPDEVAIDRLAKIGVFKIFDNSFVFQDEAFEVKRSWFTYDYAKE